MLGVYTYMSSLLFSTFTGLILNPLTISLIKRLVLSRWVDCGDIKVIRVHKGANDHTGVDINIR